MISLLVQVRAGGVSGDRRYGGDRRHVASQTAATQHRRQVFPGCVIFCACFSNSARVKRLNFAFFCFIGESKEGPIGYVLIFLSFRGGRQRGSQDPEEVQVRLLGVHIQCYLRNRLSFRHHGSGCRGTQHSAVHVRQRQQTQKATHVNGVQGATSKVHTRGRRRFGLPVPESNAHNFSLQIRSLPWVGGGRNTRHWCVVRDRTV